jgi:EAL domain-containing protein (putative c-di-GMP-specific phosphodiesterase class I)
VSLSDRSIHHSEALIRWTPRDEDPISPDIFIPIAEETGKICEIGNWVMSHVFQQMDSWQNHYGICPRISINVSTRQLVTDQLRRYVEASIKKYSLPPEAIEIELTETGVMSNPEVVLSELVALHELGLRISLDDFGTGNSSLEYLRKLPIDQVKIDKCFVHGIGNSHHDEEIIRVIVAIARALDLTIVAEGIETQAQLAWLKDAGCHMGQGYLFHRPLDGLAFRKVMDSERESQKVLPTFAEILQMPAKATG